VLEFPNAKINLGLHILGKRPDGFHNIETVFNPIPLRDALEVVPASDKIFNFRATGLEIPGEINNNLCIKAYQLLSKDFDLLPVHMHLHKVIPIGAGLGGGSSDGAFTIRLLNSLFGLTLSVSEMQDYARKLGSDCPFFIKNKPLIGYERGDRFKSVALNLSGYYLAVIIPDIHVPTGDAYARVIPHTPDVSLKEIITKPVEEWKSLLSNDFEPSVFQKHPFISDIKDKLYDNGAVYASMSGSGSGVYGLFADPPVIKEKFPDCFTFVTPNK